MKHILMACGTSLCTSTAARMRVEKFLASNGYAQSYEITQCKMADVPTLSKDHDFLIAITMIPATLNIPYIDGIPFLTGRGTKASEQQLLDLMQI